MGENQALYILKSFKDFNLQKSPSLKGTGSLERSHLRGNFATP